MADVKDLERRLTLTSVIAICISSMLGSGIFVLPGVAIAATGPSVWIAYILAGLCVLPAALSKAELATAMPTSGGTYVYLERTFGPYTGTLAGIGLWISLVLKSGFALIGTAAYLMVMTDVSVTSVAIVACVVITGINLIGVGKVSASVLVVVVIALTSLSFVGGFGIFTIEPANFDPMFPEGTAGLMATVALVFVSYSGVTKVAAIAEEIKQPEKNIPRGILTSLFVVSIFYAGITFVLVGNIPWQSLTEDLRPIHTLAKHVGGNWIGYGAAGVAILTMASMANSGLLAASRFPFAMSRDMLLPSFFGQIHKKFKTPYISILLTGGTLLTAILLLDVVKIAKLASSFKIMMFISVNIAVIVLRETRVQWYAPAYKSPLYPFPQIFGTVSGFVLLISMGMMTVYAFLAVAIPGTAMYLFYVRPKTQRKGVVGVRIRRKDLEQPLSPTLADADAEANVVVSLFGNEKSPEMVVELGAALAGKNKLEVIHLTEVPEQSDIHDLDEMDVAAVQSLRRRIRTMALKTGADIDFDHIASHDIYQTVHAISSRLHCEWLIKEWGGRTHGTFTLHRQMGWLEDHLACHVATFRDAGVRHYGKILFITEFNSDDRFMLETCRTFAVQLEASLYVGAWSGNASTDIDIAAQRDTLARFCDRERIPCRTEIFGGTNYVDAVVEQSTNYDLIIMRQLPPSSLYHQMFGTPEDKIIAEAQCSVVCISPITE